MTRSVHNYTATYTKYPKSRGKNICSKKLLDIDAKMFAFQETLLNRKQNPNSSEVKPLPPVDLSNGMIGVAPPKKRSSSSNTTSYGVGRSSSASSSNTTSYGVGVMDAPSNPASLLADARSSRRSVGEGKGVLPREA